MILLIVQPDVGRLLALGILRLGVWCLCLPLLVAYDLYSRIAVAPCFLRRCNKKFEEAFLPPLISTYYGSHFTQVATIMFPVHFDATILKNLPSTMATVGSEGRISSSVDDVIVANDANSVD